MTPWLRSSQGNHSRQQYTNNQQQTRLKNAKLILHHKYETAPHHYPFSFPFRRGTNERVGNCVPFPANRGPGCCRHALHPLPHSTSHASPSRFPNRPQLVPLNTTQDSSTTHSLLASASRQTPGLSEWKKEGRKEGREPESASSFVVVVVTTHRTKTPSGVRGHRPSINFRRFFDSSIFRFFDFFAIFHFQKSTKQFFRRRLSSSFVVVRRRSSFVVRTAMRWSIQPSSPSARRPTTQCLIAIRNAVRLGSGNPSLPSVDSIIVAARSCRFVATSFACVCVMDDACKIVARSHAHAAARGDARHGTHELDNTAPSTKEPSTATRGGVHQ